VALVITLAGRLFKEGILWKIFRFGKDCCLAYSRSYFVLWYCGYNSIDLWLVVGGVTCVPKSFVLDFSSAKIPFPKKINMSVESITDFGTSILTFLQDLIERRFNRINPGFRQKEKSI
jgi:hypothetical protein